MRRILSLVLAITMLLSGFSLSAFAEEPELPADVIVDEWPEPTPEPTAEPTPEPTAEPTPEPTAEPTPEPTAEPTPEPTAEPAPEEAAAVTPEPFEAGYVWLKADTTAYKAVDKKEEAGRFTEKSLVYARLYRQAWGPWDDWFEVAFHTAQSREEEGDYTLCYVQRSALVELTEDERDALEGILYETRLLKRYEDNILPVAEYEPAREIETAQTEPEQAIDDAQAEPEPDAEDGQTEPESGDAQAGPEPEIVIIRGTPAPDGGEDVLPADAPRGATSVSVTASANRETAGAGESVVMTATVAGAAGTPTYQWQKSSNGWTTWSSTNLTGNKTPELSFTATETRLSYEYRLSVKDDNGTYYSNPVKVDFVNKPRIKVSANRTTAVVNASVVFTATVTNAAGTPTYQWQKSSNGWTTWSSTNLTGNKTPELSFTATETRLSYEYRLSVTDDNGTWFSDPVKVDYILPPTIEASADRETAGAGESVVFTATVAGTTGTLTYQWQKSGNGTSWSSTNLTGNKTLELSFEATETRLSNQYRLSVKDDNGTWYSNPVKVDFAQGPTIEASANRETAGAGESVVFTATVTGETGTPAYQWQKSNNGGASWSSTNLPGNKTLELAFDATETRLSYEYRLSVTDGSGTHFSAPVKVTFVNKPRIKVSANRTTAPVKASVVFTATVTNAAGTPAYQWQKSNNGGVSWSSTNLTGNKTLELSFEATETRLSYEYRLSVKDDNGTWFSDPVKVDYVQAPVIEATVNQTTAVLKDIIVMTGTTSGTVGTPVYQWQKSGNGGASWSSTNLPGNKTLELTFDATEARLSYEYRLSVKDDNGTWFSNAVRVSLSKPMESVVLDKETLAMTAGMTATLTATILPADATVATTIAWTSSDAAIATVSEEGVVTAVAAGTADITVQVTDEDGAAVSATCAVTVYPDDGATGADQFTYATQDGVCVVTGYLGTEANITLPRISSDGQLVAGVAANAFSGNATIASVVLPDYIQTIGAGAFENCAALASAQVLCGTLTEIPASAFADCANLATVTLPNSVTVIGYRAFYHCTALATMTTVD